MKFAVITLPYSTDTDAGTAAGPKALLQAGLADWLRAQGHAVAGPFHLQLIPEEAAAYGAWNQIGLANAHLARLVSDAVTAHAFDRSIRVVPVDDVRGECRQLCAAMNRLSGTADLIYIHFDADALDQAEVASMRLTESNGPRRTELAAALKIIMAYPKVAALGIADINPEGDVDGQMVQAVLAVIKGRLAGVAG